MGGETFRKVWFLYIMTFVFSDDTKEATFNSTQDFGSNQQSWRKIAENRSILVKRLLSGYDKRIRPYTGTRPLEVRVDTFVSNIWAIEEAKMDFTVDMYLRQYWRDPRLAFGENGLTSDKIILTLNRQTIDEIWVPSTYFFNAKKAYFHDVTTDNYLLQIRPNGDVFYSVRLTVTMACTLSLQMFPHDRQVCNMMTESYGYQATDVYYKWNSRNNSKDVVYISKDLEMPQFKILEIALQEKVNMYNIGPHSALVATFQFHRRLGYYMIQTYVPSMLTVTISWFSFWISPDSPPARVGLGITTVLTMITISNSARAPLPKVSYTKAIDWFLLMCLVFVFGALMEYAVVNFYACKYKKRKPQKRRNKKCQEHESRCDETATEDEKEPWFNGNATHNTNPPALSVVVDEKGRFTNRSKLGLQRNTTRSGSQEIRRIKLASKRTAYGHECVRNPYEEAEEEKDNKPYYFWDPYDMPLMMNSKEANNVDKYARIYFPVTFLVLNSVYWIVYAPDEIIF